MINRIKPLLSTSVDSAGLDVVNWTELKVLESPCVIIRIINNSKMPVEISYGNGEVNDFVRADDSFCLNFQANKGSNAFVAQLHKGTLISVRGTASAGQVYFAGYSLEG